MGDVIGIKGWADTIALKMADQPGEAKTIEETYDREDMECHVEFITDRLWALAEMLLEGRDLSVEAEHKMDAIVRAVRRELRGHRSGARLPDTD